MALHTYSLDAALAALPGFPELSGRRTRLRAPRTSDADALLALYSDPDVVRYRQRPPMASRDEALGTLAEYREGFETRTRVDWMLTRRDDDTVIGTCALFDFDTAHRSAEIGYALQPAHWGRGLARDAVARVIAWGVASLGLACIDASIDPRNEASRKLLQALGFEDRVLVDGTNWLRLVTRQRRGA